MKGRTQVEIDKINQILEFISEGSECEKYKDILHLWYVKKVVKEDIAGYLKLQKHYRFF